VEIRKSGTITKAGWRGINLELWNGEKTTPNGDFIPWLVPEFLSSTLRIES
jgi:hypothetical protein